MKTGFFAFPSSPDYIGQVIEEAIGKVDRGKAVLTPWSEMAITGLKIDSIIRDRINHADVLYADITYPNFNVYYEIGYAIGRIKTVVPCVNTTFSAFKANSSLVGFFDTIGQCKYSNSDELSKSINDVQSQEWISSNFKSRDYSHPLFILDTLVKSDFRNWIFQATENSRINLRTFDPEETPRLTAYNCIADVSASAGVIVPILHQEFSDAHKHKPSSRIDSGFGARARAKNSYSSIGT